MAGSESNLFDLVRKFEEDALPTALSMGFSVAELWIPDRTKQMLVLASLKAHDHDVEKTWCNLARNYKFHEGKGIVGRVYSTKRLEWCEDLTCMNKQLVPRSSLAMSSGIVSAFAFPGFIGKLHYVVVLLSTRKLHFTNEYVRFAGAMVQKWEQRSGENDPARSWSEGIRSQVREISTSFRLHYSIKMLKSRFEGVEIWLEDNGILWVAESLATSGLEKWKEENESTFFRLGEGLVGRVAAGNGSEGLVEQQLYSTLKFKRAVMAQACGVRTVVGVQTNFQIKGYKGMNGVVCFISRDSISMGKGIFEEAEASVTEWVSSLQMPNQRLQSLPIAELLPEHLQPVVFRNADDDSMQQTSSEHQDKLIQAAELDAIVKLPAFRNIASAFLSSGITLGGKIEMPNLNIQNVNPAVMAAAAAAASLITAANKRNDRTKDLPAGLGAFGEAGIHTLQSNSIDQIDGESALQNDIGLTSSHSSNSMTFQRSQTLLGTEQQFFQSGFSSPSELEAEMRDSKGVAMNEPSHWNDVMKMLHNHKNERNSRVGEIATRQRERQIGLQSLPDARYNNEGLDNFTQLVYQLMSRRPVSNKVHMQHAFSNQQHIQESIRVMGVNKFLGVQAKAMQQQAMEAAQTAAVAEVYGRQLMAAQRAASKYDTTNSANRATSKKRRLSEDKVPGDLMREKKLHISKQGLAWQNASYVMANDVGAIQRYKARLPNELPPSPYKESKDTNTKSEGLYSHMPGSPPGNTASKPKYSSSSVTYSGQQQQQEEQQQQQQQRVKQEQAHNPTQHQQIVIEREAADLERKTNGVSKGLEYLLFRHAQIRGKRLHECKFCGKTFTKKGNWRAHLRVHTQEKPFVCGLCGRGFSQKSNMKRHAKSHERDPKSEPKSELGA